MSNSEVTDGKAEVGFEFQHRSRAADQIFCFLQIRSHNAYRIFQRFRIFLDPRSKLSMLHQRKLDGCKTFRMSAYQQSVFGKNGRDINNTNGQRVLVGDVVAES